MGYGGAVCCTGLKYRIVFISAKIDQLSKADISILIFTRPDLEQDI